MMRLDRRGGTYTLMSLALATCEEVAHFRVQVLVYRYLMIHFDQSGHCELHFKPAEPVLDVLSGRNRLQATAPRRGRLFRNQAIGLSR